MEGGLTGHLFTAVPRIRTSGRNGTILKGGDRQGSSCCSPNVTMRTFAKRKWVTFWQKVAVTIAEKRWGGTHLRGDGWRGFAVEAPRALAVDIQDGLDWIHSEVKRVVHADFDLAPSRMKWDVLAFHCPLTVEVDDLVRTVTQRGVVPIDSVDGRYIAEYGTAVLSGAPASLQFYTCATHEMCHALCHCLLGATGSIPWSFEGYAELVSDRVVNKRLGVSILREHLSAFKSLRMTAADLPLRRVLMIEDYGERTPPCSTAFIPHAALFVAFLKEHAEQSATIRRVFNAAVREDVSSCLALIESLEEASGKTVEQIEEDFRDFCSNL